jgi:acyl-coenzyme A thioesterase PaaI-like protein
VSFALQAYNRLSPLPLGKWLFSKAVCIKAPYFATIKPHVAELRPGYSEVHAKNRRGVHNHLGTFHAIAMCNMAELAAGTLTDVSIPDTHRWIPTAMHVQYLKKATTDLRAVAELDPLPQFGEPQDLEVVVRVLDTANDEVVRAAITMRVSPKARAADTAPVATAA